MDELERLPDEDELAERGRLLVAGAVARTRAPLALRERLEDDRASAAGRPRTRRRPLLAAALGALAAAVLVGALVLGGSGGPAPRTSVVAVARAAAAPPTGGAPQATGDGFVAVRVGDVRFPDWGKLSWPATGRRTDVVGGREVRTVSYAAPDGTRAGYSVVAGPPLRAPRSLRGWTVRGTTYHVMRMGGDRVVVWERGGHTCVLRAPASVTEARLVKLAAWEPPA